MSSKNAAQKKTGTNRSNPITQILHVNYTSGSSDPVQLVKHIEFSPGVTATKAISSRHPASAANSGASGAKLAHLAPAPAGVRDGAAAADRSLEWFPPSPLPVPAHKRRDFASAHPLHVPQGDKADGDCLSDGWKLSHIKSVYCV